MPNLPILTIIILLPLFSSIFIALFVSGKNSPNKQLYATYAAILSSILTFICSLYLLYNFNLNQHAHQFVENYEWVANIGLNFYVGVDGISILFIILTALLTLVCIIGNLFTIKHNVKEFLICILLLESLCIGAFSSLNLLLFFIFFEATLIPMFIIIGVWGGENKNYAAFKFFLYTFFGSLFFLLGIIFIFAKTHTFNISTLTTDLAPQLSTNIQRLVWLSFFISFAIKIPMVPFHTWLPDAHVEAPTAGSILLAGLLLKLGGYAFIKILLPLLPEASVYFSKICLLLSAVAVIFASFIALVQTDMKKMIAYSSIAHMGYVTGGIFSLTAIGLAGAVFQMLSHGLISASLFFIVGVLYKRNHTKEIDLYGGVITKMPLLATIFIITILGSMGLPGTSGFIGELTTLIGISKVSFISAIFIAFGMVISAVYMLKLYKKIMLGPITNPAVNSFEELQRNELLALVPLVVLIVYLGLLPMSILKMINPSAERISNIVKEFK